jgi:Protein of unknown function (DUF2868)
MDGAIVSWKIADVLDFEWLVADDGELDQAALRSRDRALSAQVLAPDRRQRARSRSEIFWAWLQARRSELSETLPGEYFLTAWQLLVVLSALTGVGLGMSVAAALLLAYTGKEPVNVGWFFACTVGIQWLILLASLLIWFLRRTTHLFENFRPLRNLLAGLLWSLSAALQQLPGEQRQRARARLMGIRRKSEVFHLLVWPLLMITQIFGVFFNVGVLVALLLPLGRDVAFGWQSTLTTSPETVYRLVSSIASPWSFLPQPHPTRQDILESRFSYSEGIHSLSLPAMTSWWPFLFYATFFYGFIVRIGLLVWCVVGLRAALRGFTFNHAGHNALFRRLTGPVIQGHLETAKLEVPESFTSVDHKTSGVCLALIASELEIPESEVELGLSRLGWQLSRPILPLRIDDPSGNAAALDRIVREASSLAGIAVLIGARRTPIRAIALMLQRIARAAGVNIETLVLLVHADTEDVSPQDLTEKLRMWRNFLAIHDLQVGLEGWPR